MYETVQEYLDHLTLQNYARGTLGHIRRTLREVSAYLHAQGTTHLTEIKKEHVTMLQAMFMRHKAETAAHKTSHLRRFLREAYLRGAIREDVSHYLKAIRCRSAARVALTRSEVLRFIRLPDTAKKEGVRDRAILELMYSSALRRGEVVRLGLYDVNLSERVVRVYGKGRKERMIPLGKEAAYWIACYVRGVRGAGFAGFLFLNLRKRGALSEAGVGRIFRRYSVYFGKAVSSHALRHACATHMLQGGASSRMIQAFLGHTQLYTTQFYTHVLKDDLQAAHTRHHPRRKLKT